MGTILDSLLREANTTPVHGVFVGIYGLLVQETDEFQMDGTDDTAKTAAEVRKRYGKRAFGFRRCHYLHGGLVFDDAGWIYIGGRIETLAHLESLRRDDDLILIGNMRSNGFDRVIFTGGHAFPLYPEDVIIGEPNCS